MDILANMQADAPVSTDVADAVVDVVENKDVVDDKPVETLTKAEIRKLKLKVDGEDLELPEDEVIKLAQKGKYADKQMQSAAQAKRQSEELIKLIKNDPWAALSHPSIGHDIKKLIQDRINESVAEASLTDEEKEHRDTQRKLKEYQDKEETAKKEEREAAIEKIAAEKTEQWNKEMTEALTTNQLPKTPYTIERICHWMEIAIKKGHKVSPKDVVPLVKEDYKKAFSELYGAADEDTLAELLGENLGKASKAYVKKSQKKDSRQDDQAVVVKDANNKAPKKTMNEREWLARFDAK